MKLKPLTAFALLVLLAACEAPGKRGNGNVVTQTRTVPAFNQVVIKGIFPVQLSQDSGTEWVKVETDDNLQELITASVEGQTLKVDLTPNARIQKSTRMKVYINVRQLRYLKADAVGSLSTTGTLQLDSLQFISESVGGAQLNLHAQYLHADIKSVGSTTLKGYVNEARINNKGVGALHAFGLKTNTCMIHNSAIGITEIYADSAFYIRSSAVGKLSYKGPAAVKELNVEGLGKVQQIK